MIKKYIIKGEDPNCDFGGYHSNPIIGYAEGTYENVLQYAKTISGWFAWGSGGKLEEYIEKEFMKIDENTLAVKLQNDKELRIKQDKLKKEKAELETRLSEINRQI